MNLNQLEYFISAAESLNFTKAAAKCFISQTAMTQQIRSLEKTVGVPLFIRDKHHVELTTAGRVYLHEARAIIKKSNEAIRLVRTVSEGVEGKIRIGFCRGYGQSYLAERIKEFHMNYPNIEISFVNNNMSILLDMIGKGELDLAFTTATTKQEYSTLECLKIESYPLMAALPRGHELASKPYLTYQELEHEEFIMMQPTDRPKDQMEESMLIYERGGYLPNIVAIEGDPEILLLMISLGMGISILPEYIVQPFYRKEELVLLPIVKADNSAETIDIEARWEESNLNPAVERLIEELRE